MDEKLRAMLGDEGKTPTLTDHFPDLAKMVPLTMEQLREMDGQPVWVKVIGKTEICCDGWCEVEIREKDPFYYVWWPGSEVEDIAKVEDYGKTWVCYAYPPAHIDRESWEPCEECQPNKLDHFILNRYGIKFCRYCGRPLTPEAWAEQEQRMGVMV